MFSPKHTLYRPTPPPPPPPPPPTPPPPPGRGRGEERRRGFARRRPRESMLGVHREEEEGLLGGVRGLVVWKQK